MVKELHKEAVSASGPLNLCDLAHTLPFTLPGEYSVDPVCFADSLNASPH